MAIDFTLTEEQKKLQADVRDFAQNVLAPVVREADAEQVPLRGFQLTAIAPRKPPRLRRRRRRRSPFGNRSRAKDCP